MISEQIYRRYKHVNINYLTLLSLIAAAALLVYHPAWCAEKKKIREEERITVVIRYDDFSSLSRTGMNLKFLKILRHHHIRCTFGVIPLVTAGDGHDISPQDTIPLIPEKVEFLKSAIKSETVEVALHGFRHQNVLANGHPWRSDFFGVKYSEFFGLDYHSQREKIQEGLTFLKELLKTEITTFIPPWNSYDRTTLSVLEEVGFNCISGGTRGYAPKNCRLQFLPATCSILQLREVVEMIRSQDYTCPLIVVMLHGWELLAPGSTSGSLTLDELDDLLGWLTTQEDITFKSIDQLASLGKKLGARRFNNYNSYRKSLLFTPPLVNSTVPGHYLTNERSSQLKVKYWSFNLLYYLAILLLSFITSLKGWIKVFAWRILTRTAVKYAGPVAFVLLLIGALRTFPLGYPGATAVALLIGISAGACWAVLLSRRKPVK